MIMNNKFKIQEQDKDNIIKKIEEWCNLPHKTIPLHEYLMLHCKSQFPTHRTDIDYVVGRSCD
jgi:hypothetical protein